LRIGPRDSSIPGCWGDASRSDRVSVYTMIHPEIPIEPICAWHLIPSQPGSPIQYGSTVPIGENYEAGGSGDNKNLENVTAHAEPPAQEPRTSVYSSFGARPLTAGPFNTCPSCL